MNYKKLWIILGCAAFVAICAGIVATKIIKSGDKMENTPSKVYYVREITPENLIKIYDALGVELRGNVGIKVSTDPVANDQAFVDMIYASTDPGAKKLQERIDRQMGRHILPYAESIGLGTTKYELIEL